MTWPIEEIPDADQLFLRVHRKTWYREGQVDPGAFTNHGGAMSCDWEKYGTAAITRAGSPRNPPEAYVVVSLRAGPIRGIPNQTVVHSPSEHNRAHSDVAGEKDPETRVKLRRVAMVVLNGQQ